MTLQCYVRPSRGRLSCTLLPDSDCSYGSCSTLQSQTWAIYVPVDMTPNTVGRNKCAPTYKCESGFSKRTRKRMQRTHVRPVYKCVEIPFRAIYEISQSLRSLIIYFINDLRYHVVHIISLSSYSYLFMPYAVKFWMCCDFYYYTKYIYIGLKLLNVSNVHTLEKSQNIRMIQLYGVHTPGLVYLNCELLVLVKNVEVLYRFYVIILTGIVVRHSY